MAVKMYKGENSIMVRGMNVKARLNEGWTFEPSTKITLKPRRTKRPIQAEVIETTDLPGPEDLINKETTNGD
jgi:hypothetical protein